MTNETIVNTLSSLYAEIEEQLSALQTHVPSVDFKRTRKITLLIDTIERLGEVANVIAE